jgi:hypothetical protein
MNQKIKIVSNGTAIGTHVYTAEGAEIKGITKIEIHPLVPGGLVSAQLTVVGVALELLADGSTVEKKKIPAPPKSPLSRIVMDGVLRYATCPLCHSTMTYRYVLFGQRKCIHPECGHTEN